MFQYEKKLQYPVRIATPNPALAKLIITQYGGPDGELGAMLLAGAERVVCVGVTELDAADFCGEKLFAILDCVSQHLQEP